MFSRTVPQSPRCSRISSFVGVVPLSPNNIPRAASDLTESRSLLNLNNSNNTVKLTVANYDSTSTNLEINTKLKSESI